MNTPNRVRLSKVLTDLTSRYTPPVDPCQLSAELGVSLLFFHEGECISSTGGNREAILASLPQRLPKDGLFLPGQTSAIFLAGENFLHSRAPTKRQRFVWAHELAHYFIWQQTGRATSGDYWMTEADCNWFAGELLVPKSVIADTIGKPSQAWLSGIQMLAIKCGVSWDVAAGCVTSYANGRVIFLRGKFEKIGEASDRLKITSTSTSHLWGRAYGKGAFLTDVVLIHKLKNSTEGDVIKSKLNRDIGGLQTRGCWLIGRKNRELFEFMVRLVPGQFPRVDDAVSES